MPELHISGIMRVSLEHALQRSSLQASDRLIADIHPATVSFGAITGIIPRQSISLEPTSAEVDLPDKDAQKLIDAGYAEVPGKLKIDLKVEVKKPSKKKEGKEG